MLMNRIETVAVNNPARRLLQRQLEARRLIALGGRTPGLSVLEIGCGSGYGTKLIVDQFGAGSVVAIDLDPAMVDRARHRLRRYRNTVEISTGSADNLPFPDAHFQAVFDFGIIHHVEDWRLAIAEVARVLRPGGRFYFDEVTSAALARPTYKKLFKHPEHDRFSAGQLMAALQEYHLGVDERWQTVVGSDYVLGVATRD